MSDLKERIITAAKEMQLVNFASLTQEGKPWVRYVMARADNDLVFRFCTRLESRKVSQIRKNPAVHISLGVSNLETARHWLQVEGVAEVTTEKDEREAFWFDDLTNYFSGPDDPAYCIVMVKPTRIEFGTMGRMTPEVWDHKGEQGGLS